MNFSERPTPPQLFRKFERGIISREELHELMSHHAQDLIDEMIEARKKPKTSYIERIRNLAAVRKLTKKHGASNVREVLAALGEIEGFPPSQILWNANHADVPLHCFIRSRIEPVFRIPRFEMEPMIVSLDVEYGSNDRRKTIRETILFQRDAMLRLELLERLPR